MNKKIKIAVNSRFLISNKLEGIGTYTHQVLQRLVKLMPEVEFHFLFDRKWSSDFIYNSNVFPHKISPQARHPFLWYWWFEKSVYNWLKENPVNLFLSLDSLMSLKTETKTLLVMHDLAYIHYPSQIPFLVRNYYKYFFFRFAKKANKILAVSQYTKNDIIEKFKISPSKIEIAYCGVAKEFVPISLNEKKLIQEKLTNSKPYYICIGSLNPRKNIQRIVQAFNLLKKENKSHLQNHQLVIVGAKGWKTGALFNEIKNAQFKKDIILTGHIESKKLAKILASAEALVYPSLFEGFGIPVIESFSCEVPVITSNVSSTKEIGEGSSLLVNPFKVSEIKEAMNSIIINKKFRSEYIQKGKQKAFEFNWDKTALVFKKEIEKILINNYN